jgi:hypothetical protein
MPDNFKIGLEFQQQGAENIGDSYEAQIDRMHAATEKANQEQQAAAERVRRSEEALAKQVAAKKKKQQEEEEKGGGIDPALLRHWGSVAGNAVGFRGLGMLAAAGGATAGVGIAITALIEGLQKFHEQIEAIVAASRQFDTVEQRIDSIDTRTRQVTLHNKEFALSYQDIARQVHTVAIAIQHMIELDHVAIEMVGKLDDAETRRALALNNLQNMYNPVERIRQEEAIREAAYQRQVQREKELEQLTLARKLQEFQDVGEREQMFTRQAKMIKEQLPALAEQADKDAERSKAVQDEEELKRKALEEERKIVQEIALGKGTPSTLARYGLHRSTVSQELNPSSHASDAMNLLIAPAAVADSATMGGLMQEAQKMAEIRLEELDEALKGTTENKQRAKQMAEESQGKLNRQKKRLGFVEDEVIKSQTEQQKTQLEAEQLDRVIEERNKTRSQQEGATRESMQIERDIQIRQLSPPAELPPTGGGASVGNEQILEQLKQLVILTTEQNAIWRTG